MAKTKYEIIRRSPSLNWILIRKDKDSKSQGWYKLTGKKKAAKITISAFLKIKKKILSQGVEVF